MPSNRYNTALTFLSGFETLSTAKLVDDTRTPTCQQIFAPATSVRTTASAPLDNAHFVAHLAKLREVIKSFPVTPKEVMEDVAQNRVVVWATSRIVWRDEVLEEVEEAEKAEWEYCGEYIFIFSMSDDEGKRIERIVEFLDSRGTERMRGLMERARVIMARRSMRS